ncbi:MAG: phosphotransferase [Planctomycetota bacterium]|nr:phosphotransferase [Planctomycetota bacterium]MDA1114468.1 phosphotransferase [Planctomycetota bacterium]
MNTPSVRLFGREVELEELTPEAGARRYFRPLEEVEVPGLDDEQAKVKKWLLVTSPDAAPFATTQFLQQRGVPTPQLGPCCDGAYLVEDLGDRHLSDDPSLSHFNTILDAWQPFALEPLPAKHPNNALVLDQTLFERELKMFCASYLMEYRGLESLDPQVEQDCMELAQLAAKGPTCLQHRDFHCRNFLLPEDQEPFWIDHQDLRKGPLFYDLASLYTDAYIDLSDQVFSRIRTEVGLLGACFRLNAEEAQERFHFSALQRVLKALGTFGKLLNEGRSDYTEAEERARAMALGLLDMTAFSPTIRKAIS